MKRTPKKLAAPKKQGEATKETPNACEFSMFGHAGICFFGELTDSLGETVFDQNKAYQLVITLRKGVTKRLTKSTLLHELLEAALRLSRCEYECSNSNNARIFYQLDHGKMDMICEIIHPVYERISAFTDEYYETIEDKKNG